MRDLNLRFLKYSPHFFYTLQNYSKITNQKKVVT